MAFTIIWNVDADGDWGTASNWSGDRLPTSSDDVGIDTADFHTVTFSTGTVTVDSLTVGNDAFDMTGGSLTLSTASSFAHTLAVSGATLSLGGATTVSGLFTEDAGTIAGTGTLTLAGGATFSNDGTDLMTDAGTTVFEGATTLGDGSFLEAIGGRVLENTGTFTETDANTILLGTFFSGAGTLQNDAGATIIFDNTGPDFGVVSQARQSPFTNAGTVQVEGGGVTTISTPFTNTGTVSVTAGALDLTVGSSSLSAITVAAGAEVEFVNSGLPFAFSGGTSGGTGTFAIDYGAISFTAASTFSGAFDFYSGSFAMGANAVTVDGLFSESPGPQDPQGTGPYLLGTGTLTLAGGASLSGDQYDVMTGSGTTIFEATTTLTSDSFYADGGRVLENKGTFTVGDSGQILLGENPFETSLGGGTLRNVAGATLIFDNDSGSNQAVTGEQGATSLINGGTVQVTGGGETQILASFLNNGTVQVQAGELDVVGAMTGTGAVAVTSRALFVLDASGTSIANAVHVTSGAADLTSGSGKDTFTFDGNFSSQDSVNGGADTDQLVLNGDYAGLSITGAMMTNVEALVLSAGHNYNLTTADAVVGAGQTLAVTAAALSAANALTFNGSAETDGRFAITGGAGNDVLTGGSGNDTFTLTLGGNDRASGGAGNDTFSMGAAMTAADRIDGGTGTDSLLLAGDYSAGLTFAATTLVNVETVTLGTGFSYKLVMNDANVAAGQTLTVNGGALAAGNTLVFNGLPETDGSFSIIGGAGNDILTGGAGADRFNLAGGGNDIAKGEAGNDVFSLGAAFTAADRIDGGSGQNTVILNGDYSAGLVLAATTMVNVETLTLSTGHSYRLVTNDATVAAGQTLTVNGSALGAGNSLAFNGGGETDGSFSITGGAGHDLLTGGAGNDVFILSAGGNDTANGGGGNDFFFMGGALSAADRIDGGAGIDTVNLNGDYSAGLTFSATTMVNVEKLTLSAGHSYNLTTDDATVAAGQTLTVNGAALGSGNSLLFNGGAETDGRFAITGGAGNDVLTGGAHSDIIAGGLGADTLDGGAGNDIFVYHSAAESSSTTFDTVIHFGAFGDKFQVPTAVTGIDSSVTSGQLDGGSFDSDLSTGMNGHLGADHAIVFTPDSGSYGGDTFLVVDQNGVAGYQAGSDLVIELSAAHNLSSLSTANFTT